MRKVFIIGFIALAGCNSPEFQSIFGTGPDAGPDAAVAAAQPAPVGSVPPPPPGARTAEEFDTTSAEERAAAVAAPEPAGERSLGTTIASLGSPTEPGIWMRTGLVTQVSMGRVVYGANGKSVTLELRPSGGDPAAGSQISLAAMRLLEAPLTGLPELSVFAL